MLLLLGSGLQKSLTYEKFPLGRGSLRKAVSIARSAIQILQLRHDYVQGTDTC